MEMMKGQKDNTGRKTREGGACLEWKDLEWCLNDSLPIYSCAGKWQRGGPPTGDTLTFYHRGGHLSCSKTSCSQFPTSKDLLSITLHNMVKLFTFNLYHSPGLLVAQW